MADYESNIDLNGVVSKIWGSSRIAITTHAKPDGDAFGSVVALTSVLRALGKDVSAWFIPPVPNNISTLAGNDLAQLYDPSVGLGEPDLFIVVDTGAWSQLSPIRGHLNGLLDRTLVIDHHLVGDLLH